MRHPIFLISTAVLTCILGISLNGLWIMGQPTPAMNSEAALIKELIAVEEELHIAREAQDQLTMKQVLADEFINIDQHGHKTDRDQYIRMVMQQGVSGVYSYDQPRLVNSTEDQATLEVDKIWTAPGYERYQHRDIDIFVKRGGRWLVKSSDSVSLR